MPENDPRLRDTNFTELTATACSKIAPSPHGHPLGIPRLLVRATNPGPLPPDLLEAVPLTSPTTALAAPRQRLEDTPEQFDQTWPNCPNSSALFVV
jgi:hypothetical protein